MKEALGGFKWGIVLSDQTVRSPREALVDHAQDLLLIRALAFDYYVVVSSAPEAMADLETKLETLLPTPRQRLLGVASVSRANRSRLRSWGGVIGATP
jgi:hypothetical protein